MTYKRLRAKHKQQMSDKSDSASLGDRSSSSEQMQNFDVQLQTERKRRLPKQYEGYILHCTRRIIKRKGDMRRTVNGIGDLGRSKRGLQQVSGVDPERHSPIRDSHGDDTVKTPLDELNTRPNSDGDVTSGKTDGSNETTKEKTQNQEAGVQRNNVNEVEPTLAQTAEDVHSGTAAVFKDHTPVGKYKGQQLCQEKPNSTSITDMDNRNVMASHGLSKPYKCHSCSWSFNKKHSMLKHIEHYHQDGSPSLKRTQPVRMGKSVCEICGKIIQRYSQLQIHLRSHTGEKAFFCDICNRGFNVACNYRRHLLRHGKKKFQCNQCTKQYFEKRHLDVHMSKMHSIKDKERNISSHSMQKVSNEDNLKFSCQYCNKRYAISESLARHLEHNHIPCSDCDKICRNRSEHRVHQLVHTSQRPFQCKTCKKGFKSKASLDQHMMCHTDYMPYSCAVCEKKFRQAQGLWRHKKYHQTEKPHVCDVCSKAFCHKADLKRHSKIHEVRTLENLKGGHATRKTSVCSNYEPVQDLEQTCQVNQEVTTFVPLPAVISQVAVPEAMNGIFDNVVLMQDESACGNLQSEPSLPTDSESGNLIYVIIQQPVDKLVNSDVIGLTEAGMPDQATGTQPAEITMVDDRSISSKDMTDGFPHRLADISQVTACNDQTVQYGQSLLTGRTVPLSQNVSPPQLVLPPGEDVNAHSKPIQQKESLPKTDSVNCDEINLTA